MQNGRDNEKLKDLIKRMQIGMNEIRFDGGDSILGLNFSSRLVTQSDALEVNKAQAFASLFHFLSGTVLCNLQLANHR